MEAEKCPKCGAGCPYISIEGQNSRGYKVKCRNCFASTKQFDDMPSAIDAWNRREFIEKSNWFPFWMEQGNKNEG